MRPSLTHFLPLIFCLLAVIAAIALMSTLSGDRKLSELQLVSLFKQRLRIRF